MLFVRPTNEIRNRTRILGFNIKTTMVTARDGYTGVRAAPYYSQETLEKMVAKDQEAYDRTRPRIGFLRNGKMTSSYTDDLTARISALPGCLANRVGALLDTRYSATNKSPFSRREWKVVLMRPMDNPLSGNFLQGHATGSSTGGVSRKHGHKNDPVQKWFLVIRGQVTTTSKSGFLTYDTSSNPWIRIDEQNHWHNEKRE